MVDNKFEISICNKYVSLKLSRIDPPLLLFLVKSRYIKPILRLQGLNKHYRTFKQHGQRTD